ncbi:ABC transporter ATP-binding protein [Cohnella sp.]|uniref:ABC transporter ATP-binding protein n=1 Tax=Cohnella sp. TaxID=1883426 RepID=UPI003562BEAC
MAHIELQRVTFTYPNEALPALSELSLSVKPGEFVVLCGPSGSGKSTLLRLLKREVSPGGRISGSILLDQVPLQEWPAREAAAKVGLVMQNPDNQLVVDTVEHELAFGMENFGIQRDIMRRRMAELAGFFGLEPLLARKTDELSGGQKQTVNLAAVLMMQPRVLLLDEPLAQLDPMAARELLGMIKRLNEEWGITVIMSEHRIDDLLPLTDRVVRLEQGMVTFNGNARDFVLEAWNRQEESWKSALPAITQWALAQAPPESHPLPAEPPLSVKETRRWLELACKTSKSAAAMTHWERNSSSLTQPLLTANGLFFAYDKHSPAVLKGLEWQIGSGDWVVLFGGNGSGKSTLLQLLAGLRPPQRGHVKWEGVLYSRMTSKERMSVIGYLAQNPLLHYAYDSLLEDLLQAASRAGAGDPAQEAGEMAERFGLSHLLARHPHDMSGGEQQLGALALTLLGKPQLLLLDEPTKGLDPQAKRKLGEHLQRIHEQGTTLLMATHDVEFAAAYANRCSLLFHGEIVADGEPEPFFQGNLFYATPLHRLLAQGGMPT